MEEVLAILFLTSKWVRSRGYFFLLLELSHQGCEYISHCDLMSVGRFRRLVRTSATREYPLEYCVLCGWLLMFSLPESVFNYECIDVSPKDNLDRASVKAKSGSANSRLCKLGQLTFTDELLAYNVSLGNIRADTNTLSLLRIDQATKEALPREVATY